MIDPLWEGLSKSFKITLILGKIVIPVTLLVVALDKLELLPIISSYLSPLMSYLGLPGEASLPLLLAYFLNIYAAIGALAVMSLDYHEITVLAVIILTSHSLLMEAPVLKFTGLSYVGSVSLRIIAGLFFGFLVNLGFLIFY